MSHGYVSPSLRERVARTAKYRSGYCLTSSHVVGTPMEIDHIVPESLGGETAEENLWLACSLCNAYKLDRISALDPQTGASVPLFNPREQSWDDHFRWSTEGDRIIGQTPIGKATVAALNLNRPVLVLARQRWVEVGWHPPVD